MVYCVWRMELKNKVIKILKDFGKLPTSRIAAIVGMNTDRAKEILEGLEKENKVKKIRETLATYWELNKIKGELNTADRKAVDASNKKRGENAKATTKKK